MKIYVHVKICTLVFITISFNIWKYPKWPSTGETISRDIVIQWNIVLVQKAKSERLMTCYKMNESQKHDLEGKKSNRKEYILNDSTEWNSRRAKLNYNERSQNTSHFGGGVTRLMGKAHQENFGVTKKGLRWCSLLLKLTEL